MSTWTKTRPIRIPTGRGYTGIAVADFSGILGQAEPQPAPLHRAILVSHTHNRLTDRQLDAVMVEMHRRNAVLGLTGLLLYKSRSFFEVLEGPQDVLDRELDRIFRDPRHYKMKVMLNQPAQKRRFDGWSMGFRRLDGTRTAQACWFNLTRRDLEDRFPHGATKEILHFLRGYLMLRFPPPPEACPTIRMQTARDICA